MFSTEGGLIHTAAGRVSGTGILPSRYQSALERIPSYPLLGGRRQKFGLLKKG
jgi:hypothetical protein